MSDPNRLAETVSPNVEFETLGELYYCRYRRLRPGKSEAPETGRSSMDEENVEQYRIWKRDHAMDDAIARIVQLEAEVFELENRIGDLT